MDRFKKSILLLYSEMNCTMYVAKVLATSSAYYLQSRDLRSHLDLKGLMRFHAYGSTASKFNVILICSIIVTKNSEYRPWSCIRTELRSV